MSLLLLFTERNTSIPGETSVTLFKRGRRSSAMVKNATANASSDEEKGRPLSTETAASEAAHESAAIRDAPAMTDTFIWKHIQYDVPTGGGQTRRLLDDVSGFVAPGKLTALMGESGAGKVCSVATFSRD
jgi:ATP-binding cassette, subfamily G (WHITE), member 2, SNQ2